MRSVRVRCTFGISTSSSNNVLLQAAQGDVRGRRRKKNKAISVISVRKANRKERPPKKRRSVSGKGVRSGDLENKRTGRTEIG